MPGDAGGGRRRRRHARTEPSRAGDMSTMAGLIRGAAEPWFPGDQRDRN
jgi:hypothetical protein